MSKLQLRSFFAALAILLATGAAAHAQQGREEQVVQMSSLMLDEIMAIPVSRIPASLLAKAEGIAIIPGMVKGGFVVGIRHGRGVLLIRDENRAWQPPVFVSMTGGSVGFQAGIQATDVILVFTTRNSLANIMRGKLTIGADAAAAAGPVGRQAAAATDARLRAEILSYSRSRGLFAGVSLDGSALQLDHASGFAYYRRPIFTADGKLIDGQAAIPASAFQLMNKVAGYTDAKPVMIKQPIAGAPTRERLPLMTPPPTGSTRPGPPAPSLSPAETARTRVITSWRRLKPLLDESWQEYLSPPVSMFLPNGRVEVADVDEVIERYRRIGGQANYSILTSRREFTEMLRSMRDFSALRNGSAKKLKLPPPPPAVRKRY